MALSKELKEAISHLPDKEKDKLLFKLINQKEDLIEQLTFQLLDQGNGLEPRRQEIIKSIDEMYKYRYETAGWLMMAMRDENGTISYHVKITKDKYGEIELTLQLINKCFETQGKYLEKHTSRNDTLCEYIARRIEFVLKKLEKVHPDIQFDFYKRLNFALEKVHSLAPATYARNMNLPKEWKIKGEE